MSIHELADDLPVRLLHRGEVAQALADARREFLAQLASTGLTVTPEADKRWWPIHRYLREAS